MYKKLLAIAGLVGIGIAGRLVPHIPNATPITAVAMASRKHVGRIAAVTVPLVAMLLSDAVIGFYDWRILLSVYVAFALIGVLSAVMPKHTGAVQSALFVVGAAVTFFLITNTAVWALSPWYDKSVAGLIYCYTLGLPFLRNMLLGDALYVTTLLGAPAALVALTKVRTATSLDALRTLGSHRA